MPQSCRTLGPRGSGAGKIDLLEGMEDKGWIKIAYIFEEPLHRDELQHLIGLFPILPGSEYGADEFSIET